MGISVSSSSPRTGLETGVDSSAHISSASRGRNEHPVGVALDLSKQDPDVLLSSHLLQSLGKKRKVYVLCGLDADSLTAAGDGEADRTTRKRLLGSLSANKSVKVKIIDLYKLKGLFGWSWNKVQESLYPIKKKVRLILYYKEDGQLKKAIEDLQLARMYLLGDTGSDTIDPQPGCEVMPCSTFSINNTPLGDQRCMLMWWYGGFTRHRWRIHQRLSTNYQQSGAK